MPTWKARYMPFVEVPGPLDRQFARSPRQATRFLDLSVHQARTAAEAAGVDHVRVVSLDGGPVRLHQDHRPGRLNLLVLDGVVVRAAFF